jgi:hypothetical protein
LFRYGFLDFGTYELLADFRSPARFRENSIIRPQISQRSRVSGQSCSNILLMEFFDASRRLLTRLGFGSR